MLILILDGMTCATCNTPKHGSANRGSAQSSNCIVNRIVGVELHCGPVKEVILYCTDNMVDTGANIMVQIQRLGTLYKCACAIYVCDTCPCVYNARVCVHLCVLYMCVLRVTSWCVRRCHVCCVLCVAWCALATVYSKWVNIRCVVSALLDLERLLAAKHCIMPPKMIFQFDNCGENKVRWYSRSFHPN